MVYFNQIIGELKDAIAVLRLKESAIHSVYEKKSATKWGIIILAVPVVVNLILSSLLFPSGFSAIFSRFLFWPTLIPFLVLAASFFVISMVAEKIFKVTNANHTGFFRVLAYASLVLWVTMAPFLLGIIGLDLGIGFFNLIWLAGFIWILAVAYNVLIKDYKMQQNDVFICLASGVVAYFIFKLILGKILVGNYYRFFF